jgi:hypothetical protein
LVVRRARRIIFDCERRVDEQRHVIVADDYIVAV